MSRVRCHIVTLLTMSLAACAGTVAPAVEGPEPPQRPYDVELRTSYGGVEIVEEPFSYRIVDNRGRVVLSTFSDRADGGYAPLAWADGTVEYKTIFSPGYTSFTSHLGEYHRDFEIDDVFLGEHSLGLRLVEADDENAPAVWLRFHVRPGAVRVEAELEHHEPRAWSVAFETPRDEAFLGLGERFNRTNQRGLDVFNYCEEGGVGVGEGIAPGPKNPWPNGEVMTSYPVPFFLSSQRYGFWLDTNYRSEFQLASRREDAWRAWHVGPKLKYEVYLPAQQADRPWPYEVIDRFTEATGRPAVPPAWAFGARRRVSRTALQNDVPEIQAMRDADVAITAVDDAMHFFPNASHFGKEAELRSFIEAASKLGYRVNGYYNSLVADEAQGPMKTFVAQGLRDQWFLREKDGSLPNLWIFTGGSVVHTHLVDFTRPSAKLAYQQSFEWAARLGYSGFMYDFGEYVPASVVAADGTSGEELHNLYPVLYAKALFEANQAQGRADDWLAFMRSGYTGASAFMPMTWSGDPAASFEDSDGLPSVVRAGINLGISGVPNYGSDIGGYHCIADGPGAANAELMIRWVQHAAFTPNMQDQDACVGAPKKRKKASLWTHPEVMDAYRRYARLHTRLFPYLYTLSKAAHRTGAPIMRHLFLEHPNEPDLASVDDAYYLGPALLVAPVVKRGQREKTLQLPAATFVDWSTGALIRGERPNSERTRDRVHGDGLVALPAPLDSIPLLLRTGHLVALLDDTIDTLSGASDGATVTLSHVADVYDVKGALEQGQRASFRVHDGTSLGATLDGAINVSALGARANEPDLLRTCEHCYLWTQAAPSVTRLQVSTTRKNVTAGGLKLRSDGPRRIRWDLYLVSDAE